MRNVTIKTFSLQGKFYRMLTPLYDHTYTGLLFVGLRKYLNVFKGYFRKNIEIHAAYHAVPVSLRVVCDAMGVLAYLSTTVVVVDT